MVIEPLRNGFLVDAMVDQFIQSACVMGAHQVAQSNAPFFTHRFVANRLTELQVDLVKKIVFDRTKPVVQRTRIHLYQSFQTWTRSCKRQSILPMRDRELTARGQDEFSEITRFLLESQLLFHRH